MAGSVPLNIGNYFIVTLDDVLWILSFDVNLLSTAPLARNDVSVISNKKDKLPHILFAEHCWHLNMYSQPQKALQRYGIRAWGIIGHSNLMKLPELSINMRNASIDPIFESFGPFKRSRKPKMLLRASPYPLVDLSRTSCSFLAFYGLLYLV